MTNPLRVILNGLMPFMTPGSNLEKESTNDPDVTEIEVESTSVSEQPSHALEQPGSGQEPESLDEPNVLSVDTQKDSVIPNKRPQNEKEDSKVRKLRSRDKSSAQANPALFHFNLDEIKQQYSEKWEQPLRLVFEKSPQTTTITKSKEPETPSPSEVPRPRIEKYVPECKPRLPSTRSDIDPLRDELYEVYHRRMERDEKGIQRIERERTALEVDAMIAQKELLEGLSWRRDILRITAIVNPNDQEELELKRKLTLKEIEMYLERYQIWKKKELQARTNKDSMTPSTSSMSPQPKMILRLPTLQGLAKRSESQSASPSPTPRPTVSSKNISSITPESRGQSAPKTFTSFFRPYTVRPRFDQLVRRNHRKSELLAFGQQIPDMITMDFDIPSEWKSWKE
ncbi:hypothetical protein AWJ20_3102 [Sugiyamaella lignohabitans]|uniref:Something about silencing protein 4 domain-containing protein n=1 Tax=Sugiyamaella lignohabitans TaxID=796027 RepID=A0A167FMA3_9ASCO|nr:uncharacterized protein AWJ20_3102 [Sugiyamaella lignohabitans]ANB15474.1 hypothetical protein AWJ20_3102 [Sugiyamaella lignohabitans]